MRGNLVFPSYDKVKSSLGRSTWAVLRGLVVLLVIYVVTMLLIDPAFGLKLLWGLLIPLIPGLTVIAPGLWRQVCPMALANQTPKFFGWSKNKELKGGLKNRAYTIAVGIFFIAVSLRTNLFNSDGVAAAAMLIIAIGLAFSGGLIFKGRSGWCGTFCPLAPIQRNYGHAPVVNVPNGFCETCVGCQKNCYDLNPKAAIFDDLYDEDPEYAAQHRLFMAMMPGMILGYYLQLGSNNNYPTFLALFCGSTLASVGAYYFTTSFLKLNIYRASALFSAVAIAEFYWFSGPIICQAITYLTNIEVPDEVVFASQLAGFAFGGALLYQGLKNERLYEAARLIDEEKQKELKKLRGGETFEVIEEETGKVMSAQPDQSLLEVLLGSGVQISASCKSGLCGSDPVMIVSGAENLSPPTDDEIATLRRLGLEGQARLACCCQVRGSVVVSQNTIAQNAKTSGKSTSDKGALAQTPKRSSLSEQTGMSVSTHAQNIVVIGNGVAGTTLVDLLSEVPESFALTLITNEAHYFYNRMALGKIVSGSVKPDELAMTTQNLLEERQIKMKLNTRAIDINRKNRVLTTLNGETIPYNKLILATGARARAPFSTFLAKSNCFVLRNSADASAILRYTKVRSTKSAIVIGGGVLGIETADSLNHLGIKTTIIHRQKRLMDQNLDVHGSELLKIHLERSGISAAMGSAVEAYEGVPNLRYIRLTNGKTLEADLFVACAGAIPNTDLAKACGLDVAKGIKVDAMMRTSDPDIFAIGDVAEFDGILNGLWPVAVAQARAAASYILGDPAPYVPYNPVLRLKSDEIDVYGFGNFNDINAKTEVLSAQPFASSWWQLAINNQKIIAASYVGAPGTANQLVRCLRSGVVTEKQLESLRAGSLEALR